MLEPNKSSSHIFTHETKENIPLIQTKEGGKSLSSISPECESLILERLAARFRIKEDQPLKAPKEFTQIHSKSDLGDQIKTVIVKTQSLFKTSNDKINSDELESLNENINQLFEKSHELKNEKLISTDEDELACESLAQLQTILLNYEDWINFQQNMNAFDEKIEESAFIVSNSMYSPQQGMNLSALEELGNAISTLKLLFNDCEKRMSDNYPFSEETIKYLALLNRSPSWIGSDYLEGLDHMERHILMVEKLYKNATDSTINNTPLERLQQLTEATNEFERLGLFIAKLQSTLSTLAADVKQLQKLIKKAPIENKNAQVQLNVKMIEKDLQQFLDKISSTQKNLPETFQNLNAAITRCHIEDTTSIDPLLAEILKNSPDDGLTLIEKETLKIIENYPLPQSISQEGVIENYLMVKRKLRSISSIITTLKNTKNPIAKINLGPLNHLEKTIKEFCTREENLLKNDLEASFNFEDEMNNRIINDATAAAISDHWVSRIWQLLDPSTWSESTKKCMQIGLTSMLLSSELLKTYQAVQQQKPSSQIQKKTIFENLTDNQKRLLENETALLGILCSDKYQTLTEDSINHLTRKLSDSNGREFVREAIKEIMNIYGNQTLGGPEIRTIISQYTKIRTASMQGATVKMNPSDWVQKGIPQSPKSSTVPSESDTGISNKMSVALKNTITRTGKVIQAFTPDKSEEYTTIDKEINTLSPVKKNIVYTGVEVSIDDLAVFSEELGGSYFEQNILIPNQPENINHVLNGLINPISRVLGPLEPIVTSESYLWKNLCQTAEELHSLAEQKKDYFKENLQIIAKKSEAEANFGPAARFATKELHSLKNKVRMDIKNEGISEEAATAKIGDALRGTIIADTPQQLLESINEVKKWVEGIGGKLAFKNMWKDLRPSGYVGVHAKILIPIENRAENEGLLTEVQFHLRKYNDGSLTSAKELSHNYYKSDLPAKMVNSASKIVSAFALCHMEDICISPETILSEQLRLVELAQPSIQPEEIGIVKSMSNLLKTQGALIVSGAPGSCKTELLDLAMSGPAEVFDLREEFLKFHFEKMGIHDPKQQKRIKKEDYNALKDQQLAFLGQNLGPFEKKLLESPNNVIILDELDIVGEDLVQGDSLAAALALVEMGGRLRDKGKEIIVILHQQGLKTPALMDALKSANLLAKNGKMVQTRFFTKNEEHQMLKWVGFSEENAASFMKMAQGLPAAYLKILKRVKHSLENKKVEVLHITEEEALKFARTQIGKNLKVMRKITPKKISALITELAKGSPIPKDYLKYKNELMETGLVAFENDRVVLSPLVIEAFENET